MNPELNYMVAQHRIADLHRASARLRIASEVRGAHPNPRRTAWMAVAAVLVGAGWGSSQFTPMLLVYRHALGLGAGSLEAMFGVYAFGLIPGLFLAGPLSDTRGRRLPVLGAAATSLIGSLC
jgi:MFS family permease